MRTAVPIDYPFSGTAWSPDGSRAAIVPDDVGATNGLPVMDTTTGKTLATIPASEREAVRSFSPQAFSPDGTALAYSDAAPIVGGNLKILDVATGTVQTIAPASSVPGQSPSHAGPDGFGEPSWSPDGHTLAAAAPTGEIALIDVASGARSTIWPRYPYTGTPHWSPDGRRLAYLTAGPGGESKRALEIVDAVAGAHPRRARLPDWTQVLAGPLWSLDSSAVRLVLGP